MGYEHPDLAHLGRMVDEAVVDVGRSNVRPALLVGMAAGSLPLLLVLLYMVIHVLAR